MLAYVRQVHHDSYGTTTLLHTGAPERGRVTVTNRPAGC